MDEFLKRHDKFIQAVRWINKQYEILGAKVYEPGFQIALKEFDEKVVKPLEESWQKLSQKERDLWTLKSTA